MHNRVFEEKLLDNENQSNAIYISVFSRHLWTMSDRMQWSYPPSLLYVMAETPLAAKHDARSDMMPIERHR